MREATCSAWRQPHVRPSPQTAMTPMCSERLAPTAAKAQTRAADTDPGPRCAKLWRSTRSNHASTLMRETNLLRLGANHLCGIYPRTAMAPDSGERLAPTAATTHTSQSATHHGRFVSRAMACENGERLASTGTNADARNKLLRPDANTCAVYVPEPRWRRMCSDQQGQPHESRTIASTEVATRQFDNHVLLNLTTLTEFVTSTIMSIESTSKLRKNRNCVENYSFKTGQCLIELTMELRREAVSFRTNHVIAIDGIDKQLYRRAMSVRQTMSK